jgi:hypothetical protein
MLKTMTKRAARQDSINKSLILATIAFDTLISCGIPTNKLNRLVVYHSTPKKLPRMEVERKKAIDLKSGSLKTARILR